MIWTIGYLIIAFAAIATLAKVLWNLYTIITELEHELDYVYELIGEHIVNLSENNE